MGRGKGGEKKVLFFQFSLGLFPPLLDRIQVKPPSWTFFFFEEKTRSTFQLDRVAPTKSKGTCLFFAESEQVELPRSIRLVEFSPLSEFDKSEKVKVFPPTRSNSAMSEFDKSEKVKVFPPTRSNSAMSEFDKSEKVKVFPPSNSASPNSTSQKRLSHLSAIEFSKSKLIKSNRLFLQKRRIQLGHARAQVQKVRIQLAESTL